MNTHGLNSPAMQAYRMYAERFGDDGEKWLTFGQYVECYLNNGYVVSTPEMFICGRPVPREAHPEDILNPLLPFPAEDCNAWFIAIMAGNPRLCWTYYPLDMEYVGYQRAALEPIRWFNMNKYRRIIMGSGSKPKAPAPPPAPPTTDNKDKDAARRMAQRNRAERRGQMSTILSNQGGGQSSSSSGKTILG